MTKPTIAVDIDEVLFPFVREFALHHNEKYQTELLPIHFTSYRFEEIIEGIDQLEALKRVKEFTGVQHESIKPVKDAEEGIKRLGKKFDIVLITARHPDYYDNTRQWLERHFPGAFKELVMIGYEHDKTVTPRTKAQVCREINAVALVDDSPQYIVQAVESGIEGILFGDYTWNQLDVLPSGVVRVEGWIELAEHLGA